MDSATQTGFVITHVHQLPSGHDYALELEPVGGGDVELAMVELVDRKGRDAQVTPVSCTGREARAWLEDGCNTEHVASVCVFGVSRGAA